ncbi:hypothetical protein KGA65_06885 [Ideonella sp. B7]|uniref:hypothetical protein n=1 Tax=Ideonella benzenivorans TaxID=2831643 RepID=UPI001CED0E77|nr:hypothetical protein [Ideonella benzenivorans]MCA6216262.1 hypothetical protein [Ideonella benzenivorans]
MAKGGAAVARADRGGWFDSIKNEALSFVKGDNNAPWAILAETVIGCVPILGQVVDARDIIKGLVDVSGAPASPLAWFNLITALIGLIPGGGDAAKRALRSVKAGATQVDDLLAMIRRIYKGDPEALLRKVLDLSTLRKSLDDILADSRLTSRLSPELKQSVEGIRTNLAKQFDSFKKEVDGWLAKGRKTSADGPPAAKAPTGTPAAKPETHAKAGTQEKAPHSDPAQPQTPNAAQQRTARFKTLANKFLGVMGEHMADYHCQDTKGWGSKTAHDGGGINLAKLNDGGHLVQLWPTLVRGRGIDAVWKTTGATKPYAIIEAKASYDPTKSLKALLGEAGDKTERQGGNSGGLQRRSGTGGKSASGPDTIRQTNGKVTQMGHGWIQRRLPKATGELEAKKVGKADYTRHVLFFSIPQAVAHAEALIKLIAKQDVSADFHAAHEVTREWGDAAIDKVVDNRAGLEGAARKR